MTNPWGWLEGNLTRREYERKLLHHENLRDVRHHYLLLSPNPRVQVVYTLQDDGSNKGWKSCSYLTWHQSHPSHLRHFLRFLYRDVSTSDHWSKGWSSCEWVTCESRQVLVTTKSDRNLNGEEVWIFCWSEITHIIQCQLRWINLIHDYQIMITTSRVPRKSWHDIRRP